MHRPLALWRNVCLFLSRWNGGSTEGMHKRAKSKAVSGKLASWVERWHLATLPHASLYFIGPTAGCGKDGQRVVVMPLLVGSRSTSTERASSNIPRACDTRFDAGMRSVAGISLDTAVQAASSFRSVVSADLPPRLLPIHVLLLQR